jgi:DnaJ-class molecular chaperone
MKDLYKTLGVAESADEATIKAAYRKLAKQFHPDVTGGDKKKTERFKEINEAYDVLGDPQKRREYDRLKHAPVRPDGMPEGFDADTFAQTFGRSRAGAGGVEVNGDFDLGDIFSSLFGGNRGQQQNPWVNPGRTRPIRGQDVAGQLELSFAEAALGGKRTIRTGSGNTVDVTIPPGVESGGRLRLPGQGGPAPGRGGSPGDLYLEIDVKPDAFLRREGGDVVLDLPITFSEAALGAKIEVPTIEGRVTVSVPPGTPSGAKLRLRGRGIKTSSGARGDQFCRIEIVAPKIKPDDAESRKLVQDLARRTEVGRVRKF